MAALVGWGIWIAYATDPPSEMLVMIAVNRFGGDDAVQAEPAELTG